MSSQKYIFIPIIIIGVLLIHHHLNTLERKKQITKKDIGVEVIKLPLTENIVQKTVNKIINMGPKEEEHTRDLVAETKKPEFPIPALSDISQQLTKMKNTVLKTVGIKQKPLYIIRNRDGNVVKPPPLPEKEIETVSSNPIGSTEYSFVGENTGKAWSEVNVSQHPKNYTSNVKDELTNVGEFFNEKLQFNDITSPYAKNNLPDRCFLNQDDEVLCNFNNRLYNIPPKLSGNNAVAKNIGNDITKSIISENVAPIQDNSYQVWNYKNDKVMNGAELYNNVQGASSTNEDFLQITNIPKNSVYAF
tara:strand:+ start:2142 stop:3053 length:912 start_codon:yes stop_codon:yes gene_type:complete